MITAQRFHDFSCGHRVYGHESCCAHLHGHNYRIHFECTPDAESVAINKTRPGEDAMGLDSVGRVIDFSVIKELLCEWLETNWDHKFLMWFDDPWADALWQIDRHGVVIVPFNPTAENMALYLLNIVGPRELMGTGVVLTKVTIEETRKCSATATL